MASILVVANEYGPVQTLQTALESLGHRIAARVASGAEALPAAIATRPDLALVELGLGGAMDGVAVAAALTAQLPIPIVYLATAAQAQRQATASHAFGWIRLPCQTEDLQAAIDIALNRYQQESHLKANQEQLRNVLASLEDATIALDRQGHITWMNPAAEALTGWQQHEAIGRPVQQVLDVLHEQTRETVENPGMIALHCGQAISLPKPCLLRTKTGAEKVIRDTATPMRDRTGEIIGSVVVLQDITKQRHVKQTSPRSQAALQQRNLTLEQFQLTLITQLEERNAQLQQAIACIRVLRQVVEQAYGNLDETQIFQTIVQGLGQALQTEYSWIALHDPSQTYATLTHEYSSEGYPSLLGIQIDLGGSPRFYLHLLQQKSWVSPPAEVLPLPYQQLLVAGSQLLVCPIWNAERLIGEVGLVTVGKFPWSPLQVELIEQIVGQCAIDLRHLRLHPSLQVNIGELELLNSLKDDFISSISHELRTPLTNMRMAVEMLQRILRALKTTSAPGEVDQHQPLWQKLEQYLQILQDEWRREFTLISDLLNFQATGTVEAPLAASVIELQTWLPQVASQFHIQARSRLQQLSCQVADGLLSFPSHPPSLERIVTELLTNACKYTPPRQSITVSAGLQNNQLELVVTNTGIEIPPEEQQKIFQPFYQMPRSSPWTYSGTGLGLALVKKLVQRLNGKIRVESGSGKTSFIVTLAPLYVANC